MGGRVINLFTGSSVLRKSINIAVHFLSPRKAQTKSRAAIGRSGEHANHTDHGMECMQTDGLNILPRNDHCVRSNIERETTQADPLSADVQS